MDPEKTCLELALQGEQYCKAGDCRKGVYFFESAIQVGTSNLKILSAIYSQMGNAYFYLQDYEKALEYHKHDLNLARTINDKLGEAKANGNVGNTLKVLGLYDEAMVYCQQHLDISLQFCDKIGEARALYNLGNVCHAKAKAIDHGEKDEPGSCPREVHQLLQQAITYYKQNLSLVTELGDKPAQGRVFGNLGNTYYLLGDFEQAIYHHQQRLMIAKEFGDKAAERRAYSNLGNAYIFQGQFELAAQQYKQTLQLSRQLGDRALEAQACYSLGNTYTLLADYIQAIQYHTMHLKIARELNDRVGEARACWSLSNAHNALGECNQALTYAVRHRDISLEIGGTSSILPAEQNLVDVPNAEVTEVKEQTKLYEGPYEADAGATRAYRYKNARPEVTPTVTSVVQPSETPAKILPAPDENNDDLFELISRSQSRRIDDQRCSLRHLTAVTGNGGLSRSDKLSQNTHQSSVDTSSKPVVATVLGNSSKVDGGNRNVSDSEKQLDEHFLDMLLHSQASRMDDQRSSVRRLIAPTVPDDDFFNLIQRLQSNRLDAQRSAMPVLSSTTAVPPSKPESSTSCPPSDKKKKK